MFILTPFVESLVILYLLAACELLLFLRYNNVCLSCIGNISYTLEPSLYQIPLIFLAYISDGKSYADVPSTTDIVVSL